MTEQDRPRFAELMMAMAETFDTQLSALRANLYFDALADLPIEGIEWAVKATIGASKFFPKPVELREFITGTTTDEAAQAWADFTREVSRVGYMRQPSLPPATMEAIRVVFGGWRQACGSLPSPDSDRAPELMGWRKQFIQAYGDTKRREAIGELDAAPSLAGILADVKAWEQKQKQIAE